MGTKAIDAIERLLPVNVYRTIGKNIVNAGSLKDPVFLWATLWTIREVDGTTRAGRIVVMENGDLKLFGEKLCNLHELGSEGKSKIVSLINARFGSNENLPAESGTDGEKK